MTIEQHSQREDMQMTAATSHVYPPLPEGDGWADILHWCVCIMDVDDPDLGFTASVLAHAIKNDGITDKQARYANKIVARMVARWSQSAASVQSAPIFSTAGTA